MADSTFVVQGAKLGMVLENDGASHTGANTTGVGSLYDNADQTYVILAHKTDVTIDTAEYEQESFQTVDDHYDHYINLRYNGAGSCTFKAMDDSDDPGDMAFNVLYAALHLPNGSDTPAGAVDLTWNGALDTNAGTQTTDLRGYAVAVEQQVSASRFLVWTFHNCRIKATPARSPKQAMTVNLSWSDARTVEFTVEATTLANHADS
jgi:hypothetical protein